ncbi:MULTISPECIES: DUF6766 family protein [Sphingobacterium]|uniref:DUF6766 family protein n=1 Tax=Sphingobacterium TaxID=28453 RepID=UPI0013D90F35|nr:MULTISPECIES: DUF6766 family protein [unclassified Sphingobacterium]
MKHTFLYRNSLSIVFLTLFAFALLAQAYFGWKEQQQSYQEHGEYLALSAYLCSGHFVAATFENFQSEFLQMALYVVLTIFLRQIGSAESKSLDEKEEVDREPVNRPNAPSPVKKGGWRLAVYKHSLSLAFLILFIASWIGHLYGSYHSLLEENRLEGKAPISMTKFLMEPQFWFETFQNWQSEFLSVASIVILSIYLRQKGSPESKPVDSPHMETGK